MLQIVKIFLVLGTFRTIICSKNVCDKDCISNVMLSRSNRSQGSDHNASTVHSILEQNIKFDKWNQLIADNETRDLPHYVIPEVSSYERGANAAVIIVMISSCNYVFADSVKNIYRRNSDTKMFCLNT